MNIWQISTIVSVSCSILVVPCLYYSLYILLQNRNKPVIKYRYPFIIIIITIIGTFILCVQHVYRLLERTLHVVPQFPDWLFTLHYSLTNWIIITLFAIKSYIVYYQYQYNLAIIQMTWQQAIDP